MLQENCQMAAFTFMNFLRDSIHTYSRVVFFPIGKLNSDKTPQITSIYEN